MTSDISRDDILKYAIENGIINLPNIEAELNMKSRRELLEKHEFKIWQGKNGLWYTYLPDEAKGRIQKQRNTKKGIEDIIVEYYKEQEENPTIKEIYNEWINKKFDRGEIKIQTKSRYDRQFEQCFVKFGKRKIKSVTEIEIQDFLIDSVKEFDLTRKGYCNMRTIIFGIFKYAKKRYISYSITEIINDMEVSRKLFRKNVKQDDEEVFMIDELPKVTEYLEENLSMVNLGLLLLFTTGMRIGELSALKWECVNGNCISVERTEIQYNDDKGKFIVDIEECAKSDAGIRTVSISDKYVWILKKLRNMNPFGTFVFEQNGKRIKSAVFRNHLKTVCKHTDVVRKSPHKIRKTYGTILIDNGVPESVIISQMGHTNIKVTKDHYYKNRLKASDKQKMLQNVALL